MRFSLRSFCSALVAVLTACAVVQAEEGVLVVQVVTPQDRPLAGVVLSTKGDGSTGSATDAAGKTRIRLAKQTKAGSWVSLQVVRSPAGQDLVFISPWNSRARVPPFENESENYVAVVLARRGDRVLLESGEALKALTANILAEVAPKSAGEETNEEQRRAALAKVSEEYGLEPDEVDGAIRAWAQRTQDPYEKGLAALYGENYPEASEQLSESLQLRESELERVEASVVDAALFLGQSLYQEGKYREAVEAYGKAAALREDDAVVLNNLGLALAEAGDLAAAEPLYQRALAIWEKALGPEHPWVATSLNNLALLYYAQGHYAQAEPLYQQALAIDEKALGPEHPHVATDLHNLALLYHAQGHYAQAEPLYQRALAIVEKALGPEHPTTRTIRNNLEELRRKR